MRIPSCIRSILIAANAAGATRENRLSEHTLLLLVVVLVPRLGLPAGS
jgi:hypothetical protein